MAKAKQFSDDPRLPRGIVILLIFLAVLFIVASAGLVYYTITNQKATANSNATATAQGTVVAQTIATANAQDTATAIAQVKATMMAQANATSTAQAIATANTTATTPVGSLPNPYPPHKGTFALNDLLRDGAHNGWTTGANSSGGACTFTGGAYHSSETKSGTLALCPATSTNFSNFAYEVQMMITKGNAGGMIFRTDRTNTTFYYFRITTLGFYALDLFNRNGLAKTLSSGFNPAIHLGLNQINVIAVVAQGAVFDLYVNQQHIASGRDSTSSSGGIGVTAEDASAATEVVFRNARVWKL